METQFTKRTYTRPQASLLMKSMLIAGIAFLIIGGLSYGFSEMFWVTLPPSNFIVLGLPICLITLILGMVISLLWRANMLKNGSVGITIGIYLLYIVTTSVAFGWLFALARLNVEAYWLPVMFAIVGGIFLLTAGIAKIISLRGIITMGAIVLIVGIIMGVCFIAFFIVMLVTLFINPMVVVLASDALCSLVMAAIALVSFVYIIVDIWSISKMSEFVNDTGTEYGKIMPWYCGFRLLTDLVNILFIAIWYLIRFSRG